MNEFDDEDDVNSEGDGGSYGERMDLRKTVLMMVLMTMMK